MEKEVKVIRSLREFKQRYFPKAVERKDLEELSKDPHRYGRYLAIRSFGKSHLEALERVENV